MVRLLNNSINFVFLKYKWHLDIRKVIYNKSVPIMKKLLEKYKDRFSENLERS